MQTHRRALVLGDEAARHPFRQGLPPHVIQGGAPRPLPGGRAITLRDCREFLMAYCACFMAAIIFIS